MTTQTIEGQLEIHRDRGVIYFHSNEGYTALRIGGLPQCIPLVIPTEALDIAHMHGCNWHFKPEPIADDLSEDEVDDGDYWEDEQKERLKRAKETKEKVERIRAQLTKLQAELDACPTTFNIQGTITGRLSCKEPNIKVAGGSEDEEPCEEETDDPKVAYPRQDVVVQIWNETREEWVDYSRTEKDASFAYHRALSAGTHANCNEQFRAMSDWGNGDELWRHGHEDPREAKAERELGKS